MQKLLSKFKEKLENWKLKLKSTFVKEKAEKMKKNNSWRTRQDAEGVVPAAELKYNSPAVSRDNLEQTIIVHEIFDQSQLGESGNTLKRIPVILTESPSPAMANVHEWICNVAVNCVVAHPELERSYSTRSRKTLPLSTSAKPQPFQETTLQVPTTFSRNEGFPPVNVAQVSSKSFGVAGEIQRKPSKGHALERKKTSASRRVRSKERIESSEIMLERVVTRSRTITRARESVAESDSLHLERVNSTSTRHRRVRTVKEDSSIHGLSKSLSIKDLKPLVDLNSVDESSNYQPSFTKGSLLDQITSPDLKRAKSVVDIKSMQKRELNRKHSYVADKKVVRKTKTIIMDNPMTCNEDEIPLFDLVMMRSKSAAYKYNK